MKRELNAIKERLDRGEGRLDKIDHHLQETQSAMRRIWITLTDFRADATEFMDFVRKNIVTRKEFDTRFEKFTADIAAAQRDREIVSKSHMGHQRRLDDHEKRLARLEAKRA